MGDLIIICRECRRQKAGPLFVNICNDCAEDVEEDDGSEGHSPSETTTSGTDLDDLP